MSQPPLSSLIIGGSLMAACLSANLLAGWMRSNKDDQEDLLEKSLQFALQEQNKKEEEEKKEKLRKKIEELKQKNKKSQNRFYDLREVTEEEEYKYGFKRPEFQAFRQNITIDLENQQKVKSNVSEDDGGTRVPFHQKHVFVLTKKHVTEWSKKIHMENFPKALTSALRKYCKSIKVKVSVAEAAPNENVSDEDKGLYDLLVMPDNEKYIAVKESELEAFASSLAFNTSEVFQTERLKGSQIFVCCHVTSHPSIEVCGPRIFKAIVEAVEKKNLHVTVRRVSDLGGHSHETNLIVYHWSEKLGKYFGDWYWNIGLNDIDELLSNLGKDKIIIDRWRGRCDLKSVNSFLKFHMINNSTTANL